MPDHRRRGLGELDGQLFDGRRRNARLGLGPGRGVGGDEGGQGLEVVEPLLHELLVVEPLGHQFVDHGEIEGIVRARPDEEEIVGLGRGHRGPDVDTGDLAAAGLGVEQVVDLLDVDGLEDVAGLQHHVLGVFQVVAHGLAAETEDRQGGVLHVPGAGRVVVTVVGRAQAAQKGPVDFPEGAAAVRKQDGLGAVLGLDLGQLLGHIGQGLVPGGPAPLALAALSGPDHGKLGPFVIVHQGHARRAAGAQRSLDASRVRIAVDGNQFAVVNHAHHRAAYRTHAAYAKDVFFHGSPSGRCSYVRLTVRRVSYHSGHNWQEKSVVK